jgi:hypothetical protein
MVRSLIKLGLNKIKQGFNQYPPNVEQVLSIYGNDAIIAMTLLRTPVPSVLLGAINAVSMGAFDKKRQGQVLFHLRMDITTSHGRVSLEKNERINMEVNPVVPKGTETMPIFPVPNITIRQLLENTQKRMGGNFFTYQAKGNNCQAFLLNTLQANIIDNPQYNAFIKQDTEGLFTDNLRKATNTITDIGAVANIIRQGGDIRTGFSKYKHNSFMKQFNEYKGKNPNNKTLKDLEGFAHFIIQYPSKFTKVEKKRAESYINVIEEKKLSHVNNIMGRRRIVKGGDALEEIKSGLEKAGEPFKAITGMNPAKLGYDLGHDIIGPALFGRGVHVHHHHYHPVCMPPTESMGVGFKDVAKKVGKVVAPAVINEGANKLKDLTGNNKIANTLIDKSADMAKAKVEGLGMKKPKGGRFVKGSPEAKEYMRKLREMRKK